MAEPPPGARAALRAAWIRHLQPERDAYACDWTGIRYLPSAYWLDLSDPFGGGPSPPSMPGADRVGGAVEHGAQRVPATGDIDAGASR